ncbi:MAG: hypothetical protein ACOY3Z_12200 [Thermodesulfobacteriota bacterium]
MKKMLNAFDRLMIAIAFAEAGEESPLVVSTVRRAAPRSLGTAMPAASPGR